MPKNVLIATIGSFGDLHPYLAIAIGLRDRGHNVSLASMRMYRDKVESEGIRFVEIPPDLSDLEHNEEKRRRAMHTFDGTRYVIEELFLPPIEEQYRILLEEARSADVTLGSTFALGLPLAAAKLGVPYLTSALQPAAIPSRYDAPLIPTVPFLIYLPPSLLNLMYMGMDKLGEHLLRPAYALAKSEGLPSTAVPKVFGHSSPHGNLILFSRHFAAEQPDFPQPTTMCGFPFYDKLDGHNGALEAGLEDFLNSGPAPFVFTLGTSAVLDPGKFYDEAYSAVTRLRRRAVFLVGRANYEQFKARFTGDHIYIAQYAPHSLLMPRGAATVHQGGVGTTAQAMRAGRPMIVVPFSHDQPDNARRITRLGCGLTIKRNRLSADSLAEALGALPACEAKSAEIGRLIQQEDGVARACEKIEATQPSPRRI
jgi:rhamnosyltransferase subunit B